MRVTDSGTPPKSAVRTFQVTAGEINQSPQLSPIDSYDIEEGSRLEFQAAATDADLPANELTYTLIGAPAGATIDPLTGQFAWTPGETDGPEIHQFRVRVTDNGTPALSAEQPVRVTVREVNEAPVLNRLLDRQVRLGNTVTFTVTARDVDVPANQLRFALAAGAPVGATLDRMTGVFQWTPTEPGRFPVTIEVSDDGQPPLTAWQEVAITVYADNLPPELASIGNRVVDELTELTFTAAASDGNATDALTFTLIDAPAGASLDPRTGEFRWVPGETDGPADYSFTVRVTDNGSPNLWDEETMTVTVHEVNRAPELSPIGDKLFTEGVLRSFVVFASDADRPAQTLTYALADGPEGAALDASTGVFSWTPAETHGGGTFTLTVRVTDSGTPALSDELSFTITVLEVNEAPQLDPIGDRAVQPGDVVQFIATATDSDVPQGALRFSLIGAPDEASLDPVTGEFHWQTLAAGQFTFTVRVTDDGSPALMDDETITVDVSQPAGQFTLSLGASAILESRGSRHDAHYHAQRCRHDCSLARHAVDRRSDGDRTARHRDDSCREVLRHRPD